MSAKQPLLRLLSTISNGDIHVQYLTSIPYIAAEFPVIREWIGDESRSLIWFDENHIDVEISFVWWGGTSANYECCYDFKSIEDATAFKMTFGF